jgi:glycine betaine/proline transport system substrate-binding protein
MRQQIFARGHLMQLSRRPGEGSLLGGLRTLVRAMAMLGLLVASAGGALAAGADPAACRVVRLADVGWTAETATTAVLAQMLTDLGYQPVTTVLSVPVTLESMKNSDIDIFLGNWMPAQESIVKPYADAGWVQVVRHNLVGAKYTLAVPDYLHEAGLKDFADIH